MTVRIRSVAKSDVGLVREANEDSGYAGPRLLVVADGMGGHAAGEVASAVAVEQLAALDGPLTQEASSDSSGPGLLLREAIEKANRRLRELVADDPGRSGMGTTVTAMLLENERATLAHIGDSRAYLWREDSLQRLTHDHTYVQALIDDGRITEEEATRHPARSLLLRALGGDEPNPDILQVTLQAEDRVLLCSDGLCGVVPDEVLSEVLAQHLDLETTAAQLVELALGGGGPDNITCVVADVLAAPDPTPGTAPVALDQSDDTTEAHLVGAAAGGAAHPDAAVGAGESAEDEDAKGADERERYRLRQPRRFPWMLPTLAGIALVLLLVLGVRQAQSWVAEQIYVGVEEPSVAVRAGVPGLPGSQASRVVEDLPTGALPDFLAEQVNDGIRADDLTDAEIIVDRLRVAACDEHPPADPYPGLTCPEPPEPEPDPREKPDKGQQTAKDDGAGA